MMTQYSRCRTWWSKLSSILLVLGLYGILISPWNFVSARINTETLNLSEPILTAGFFGKEDERDTDVYPAAAFDIRTQRYLVVWLSARNADSSSDGLDVFGRFLGRGGYPRGPVFRISDTNTAARSSLPSVTAGEGEFVVAWATRSGSSCQIAYQQVVSELPMPDRWLTDLNLNIRNHSPDLLYDREAQRYVMAFISGDDYLPPKLFGAATEDCGNNPNSQSSVAVLTFNFNAAGEANLSNFRVISDQVAGAFRPKVAYQPATNQTAVVWEDRRYAAGDPYSFDVMSQVLNYELTPLGMNRSLVANGNYANLDDSATWTARPVVATGENGFLAAWFVQQTVTSGAIWEVRARQFTANELPQPSFPVAAFVYAEDHTDEAPSGFLALEAPPYTNEFLVGISAYAETLRGYYSLATVQRISQTGELLDIEGNILAQPGIGVGVDPILDDQIGIALASHTYNIVGQADTLILYSKHYPTDPSQDFNIWRVTANQPAPDAPLFYLLSLPMVRR